jgi:formate/nitrite transporter FocA (FNT family)
MTGLLVGLAVIFAIQANAIWGKMLPAITSVRSVIVSSFVLCIALSSVAYYL